MKGFMTSKERMKKLALKEKIDRVPMIPHLGIYAARICNVPYDEYYLDPDVAYSTQMWALDLHGHDGGVGYSIPEGHVADFGGRIEFEKGFASIVPKVIRRPLQTPVDLDKLRFPDIEQAFSASRVLKFNENKFRNGDSVSISAGSAMNVAVQLIGMEKLMKAMIRDPQFVHEIMEFSTRYLIYVAESYVKRFGSENLTAGASYPVESSVIISPRSFEKFSIPYTVKVFETYKAMGIRVNSIHLCGDHMANLKYWRDAIDIPARSVITTGSEMDLLDVADWLGDDYILGGNIKNSLLESGSYMDVYRESESLIKRYKDIPGGFIFTPDCDLTASCPAGNLHAMMKAVRDFGTY